MTLYLDSETGDVYHDRTLIGNTGPGPYALQADITAVVVSEQLPSDNAAVRGEHLKQILALVQEPMEYGRPEQN